MEHEPIASRKAPPVSAFEQNESPRSYFLNRLDSFIREVDNMPRFKGQTQVLRSLKRVGNLSALR